MKHISAFLILACLVPTVFAEDITILVGHQFNPDFEIITVNPADESEESFTDLELDNGSTISLAWDFIYRDNPNQRIGFYLSHQQTDFEISSLLADTGILVTHVHFTGTSYYPNGNWEPFLSAGIGAGIFSPDDSDLSSETKISAQVATGANYKFTEGLLMRLDVRWMGTFFDGSGAIFCSGGCIIQAESSVYSQVQANIGLMFRY
jgi:opacity protein-like surface antigen